MQRTFSWIIALVFCGTLSAQATGTFRKGEWRSQDVPAGYTVKEIGRYQIQSNCAPTVVEKVGKHMNMMFKLYSKHFPSTKTPKFNLVIKLFANWNLYTEYGGPWGSGGYYSPTDKEMVGFYSGKLDGEVAGAATTGDAPKSEDEIASAKVRDRTALDTIGVFSHEGWHQYFHWSCGSQVEFPSWADEGIGDYYYSAWTKGDALVIGAPNDMRLATIQDAIESGKFVPLAKIVRYEQKDYYSNAMICYAEGWSWVHFLFEHPAWESKKYVQKFVQVFKDQHSIPKTIDIVFKGVDFDLMQKDWIQWTLAMTPISDETGDSLPSEKALARAKRIQAEMPENVRKALFDCIARRKDTDLPRPQKKAPAEPEQPRVK